MPTQQNGSEPALQSLGNLKRWIDRYLGETYGVVPMHRISGSLSTQQLGEAASEDDERFTDAREPTGAAGGILSGTFPDPDFASGRPSKADLPASVAYEDEGNTFTTLQTINRSGQITTLAGSSIVVSEIVVPNGDLLSGQIAGEAHRRVRLFNTGEIRAGDGTVASTIAAFRSVNSIQTQDALLDAIAALSMIDNRIIVGTGADAVELWTVTDFVKTLLDDADAATARATLGAKANLAPSARVRHSANQVITTATLTTLAFDTEDFDTATLHDTVTNNSRLTASVAGLYSVGAAIQWGASATGRRQLNIKLNGTTDIVRDRREPVNEAGIVTDQSCQTIVSLAATDYIEAEVRQDSGANMNLVAQNPWSPVLWMTYLGAAS